MKHLATLFLLLGSINAFSQNCNVKASLPKDTINCGESIFLSAYGRGQGNSLLNENFNNGSYGAGWGSTTQAMWTNPCNPQGVDGTTHIWMGNSSPVPRILNTAIFDLSACAAGGVTICFDMLFAQQGSDAPCEGPDEPQEGVYVQYANGSDTNWTTINYFNPNGGRDPMLINWHNWCFQVPDSALTDSTRFRWYQNSDSGADFDHWGIDNVAIYCNDTSYNITWQHDGYNAGPVGGTNPTPVAPHQTTTYTVIMSNGAISCYNTVTVVVRQPALTVDAGSDTLICGAGCLQLNSLAKVTAEPAKTLLFTNEDTTVLTNFFAFGPQLANIDVSGLSYNTIAANSIDMVCITHLTALNLSAASISLVNPDGDSINLILPGTTTGTSVNGYTNTCFATGATGISTGTTPYTGSWSPAEPFADLAGSTANGTWALKVSNAVGELFGWSISFNEPAKTYTGNISWQPNANMLDSNTLNPTVCPDTSSTYILTLTDTAGCASAADTVYITVDSCSGHREQRFARAGSGWCIATSYPMGATYSEPIVPVDTLLQGKSCSFFYGVGGLFVSNDTVYRILSDNSIRFLYDYNAQAGDTWKIYLPNAPFVSSADSSIKIHIDSVDQVSVRGTTLRRIFTNVIDMPFIQYGYTLGTVVEGVGTNYFFLPGPWGLVDDGIPTLSCFHDSVIGAIRSWEDITLLDSCTCHVWMGTGDIASENKGSIRFNPTAKKLNWELPESEKEINLQVFNIAGAEIISQKAYSPQGSVSVAYLAAGLYICRIRNSEGVLLTTKFAIAN